MKRVILGIIILCSMVVLSADSYKEFARVTYRELKDNDAKGSATFTVDNSLNELTGDRIYFNFNEECGTVKGYRIFTKEVCQTLVSHEPIYKEDVEICKITRNGTICQPNLILVGYNNTYKQDLCETQSKTILSGITDYRIEADIIPEICSDGKFGYSIDWIPVIETDTGALIRNPVWAWWNVSYSYKIPINCSNLNDKLPIVINGSKGINFGNQNHIIWSYCSGNGTALYFNDGTDYMISNDTARLPFEVEHGNGSSYNPTILWTGYRIVDHLNATSTITKDSTSNGNDGTLINNPIGISGMFGNALHFYGSAPNQAINYGDLDMFDSNEATVMFWAEVSPNPAGDFMVFMSQYGSSGWYISSDSSHKMRLYTKGASTLSFYSNEVLRPKWELYTLVRNNTGAITARMYFNITAESNRNNIATITNTMDMTLSTRAPPSYDYPINATIDEWRYYTGPLGLDYISQVYYNGVGTKGYGDALPTITYTLPGLPKVNASSSRSYNWIF